MLDSITSKAVRAKCPVWCSIADHEGDYTAHSNIDLPSVEVTDLLTGKPAVVSVDVEQTDDDPQPRIAVHGTLFPHDAKLSAADAKRIGLALLKQAALVELFENAR